MKKLNKTTLFALWGGMFILCAGLGFIPAPEGTLKWVLVGLSLAFFIPPAFLLRLSIQNKDRPALALIRNLSALSLGLTLAAIIANFLSFRGSETLGNVLYGVLIIVSSPMICGQYWLLSLFLWACLLMVSISHLLKKK